MVKFRSFWTELSAHNTSVFYIQVNNLSKSQLIFISFDMYIAIVKICFGICFGQLLTEFSAHDMIMAGYYRFTFYFYSFRSCDVSSYLEDYLMEECDAWDITFM